MYENEGSNKCWTELNRKCVLSEEIVALSLQCTCTQVRQTPSSFLPDIGDGDLISSRKRSDALITVGFYIFALVMRV